MDTAQVIEFAADCVLFLTAWAFALSGALRMIDRWGARREGENKSDPGG